MKFLILALFFQGLVLTLAQAPAPAPTGPPNITAILTKGGQFTMFIRLLQSTREADQINTQLNNSNNGLTIFAPTDNSFSNLKSGLLNSLSDQQKVELVQFHIVPNYISMSEFQTASNPLRTQAGNSDNGEYPLNVTTSGNQVNITTGVVNTTVNNAIYSDGQLAVYQVDQVLLPLAFFQTPAPAHAPAPALLKPKKGAKGADTSDDDADASTSKSGAIELINVGYNKLVFVVSLVISVYVVL